MMPGENEPEYSNHLAAEGIEFDQDQEYPEKAYKICGELNLDPAEHESFHDEGITLYRGDSLDVFEDLDTGKSLRRDFPFYFADTREAAISYADNKLGDEDNILLEADVRYEDIEIFEGDQIDVERGQAQLDPDKIHFLGVTPSNKGASKHLEFAATRIPREWISVEEI
ncbi:MAG: hypothetical protein ABEK10_00110 [Candidatus Nanosalina sp.]